MCLGPVRLRDAVPVAESLSESVLLSQGKPCLGPGCGGNAAKRKPMNDFHFFRERLGDLQALPWRFNSCAGDDVGAVETRVVLVEGDVEGGGGGVPAEE